MPRDDDAFTARGVALEVAARVLARDLMNMGSSELSSLARLWDTNEEKSDASGSSDLVSVVTTRVYAALPQVPHRLVLRVAHVPAGRRCWWTRC